MKLNITINNEKKTFEINLNDSLLDVLRREGYYGVRYGCGTGDCGACTVILNGKAILSCLMLAVRCEGKEITTIEGLASGEELHPIQKAFIEAGAFQCGYCTAGAIMSAKALLDENPNPTDDEIKETLKGNLCRCTGYARHIKALRLAIECIQK